MLGGGSGAESLRLLSNLSTQVVRLLNWEYAQLTDYLMLFANPKGPRPMAQSALGARRSAEPKVSSALRSATWSHYDDHRPTTVK